MNFLLSLLARLSVAEPFVYKLVEVNIYKDLPMSHAYGSGCFGLAPLNRPNPPRTTSATNAAEFKESATTPAQNSSNRIPSAGVQKN